MATVEKFSIALTPELANDVRTAVKNGEYASSSEVIRGTYNEVGTEVLDLVNMLKEQTPVLATGRTR